MTRVVARTRNLPPASILVGAGSSDLIFLALQQWLNADSRVLILDPIYGEYAHVLENIIRCRVDRIALQRANNYAVCLDDLNNRLKDSYDLVILVNPNSPTGQFVSHHPLSKAIASAPAGTRFWIDETYIEYAGRGQTLESFAVARPNVVVCKSMSKAYALSGARAAYLAASPEIIRELRRLSPPWSVSLLAQVAAVHALQDRGYYEKRWSETNLLRGELEAALGTIPGVDVLPGVAGFLMFHLPESGPNAKTVTARSHDRGLFVRDAELMGRNIGDRVIRVAVKDRDTNARIVDTLRWAIVSPGEG